MRPARVLVGGRWDDTGMSEPTRDASRKLSMREASDAVTGLGWRYILGAQRTCVRVGSLAQAADVASRAVAAAGPDADEFLQIDIRRDQVILTLQSLATHQVTAREAGAARQISAAVAELGLATNALGPGPRSAQLLEIAIDALDISAVRPFWKAVMGYDNEPGATGPEDALADPVGQGPAIWFQQMDAPRPQRNRIHFDVSVPHDEAAARIQATLDAGGRLIYDAEAPAFWVLTDPEGNEACVTTWQGRE
jgi:4a-hydroxytetrahydrobiopterin dehydratase